MGLLSVAIGDFSLDRLGQSGALKKLRRGFFNQLLHIIFVGSLQFVFACRSRLPCFVTSVGD